MNRVFCILVALACFTGLSQVAVQAQTIAVDDATDAATLNGTGEHNFPGGGQTQGISINAAGPAVEPSATGALDLYGTTVGINGVTTITGATGIVGAATVSTTLGVGGLATLDSASVTTTLGVGGLATLDSASVTTALGVGGLATLNSASITTTALVGGAMGVGGAAIPGTGLAVVGGTDTDTLNVTGTATIGGLLTANGGATVNGALIANDGMTVYDGTTIYSGGDGSNSENRLIVNDEIVSMRSSVYQGAQSVVVDGDSARMRSGDYEDDNYVLVDDEEAVIGGQYSRLTIQGSDSSVYSNEVSLLSDDDGSEDNARAELHMDPNYAGLSVHTDEGYGHGLYIYQDETVLSGGTDSTVMVLDDDGVWFGDEDTGDPVTVNGVADGVAPFDAVNRRQLDGLDNSLSSGIASVAALAAIPCPPPGKNYTLGVGYGNYSGEYAYAVGVKANIPQTNVSLAAGVGFAKDHTTVNAGIGLSW